MIAQPIAKTLSRKISSLKIIPHKELAYLSFDCLINKDNQYLIHDYNVSYHYSALFSKLHNHRQKDVPKNIVIFAPIYDNQVAHKLPPLRKSESEANAINSIFNTTEKNTVKVALRAEASKAQFQKSTQNYDIIHLATHTIVKKEAINFS